MLPDVGIAVFGIGAADKSVLTGFQARVDVPSSYWEALSRLVAGNLGLTLDGRPVVRALYEGLAGSLPLVCTGLGLFATATVISLYLPRALSKLRVAWAIDFLAFVPAYLPPFILLAVTVAIGSTVVFSESIARHLALGLAIGLPPAALAAAAIGNAYRIELERPYVVYMRACGFSDPTIYAHVRRSAIQFAIPALEKLFSLMIAILIFTEALASYPGFGSLFLLAVQRSDFNFILGAVLMVSIVVVSLRMAGSFAISVLEPPGLAESAP